jgi:hypothetical protein
MRARLPVAAWRARWRAVRDQSIVIPDINVTSANDAPATSTGFTNSLFDFTSMRHPPGARHLPPRSSQLPRLCTERGRRSKPGARRGFLSLSRANLCHRRNTCGVRPPSLPAICGGCVDWFSRPLWGGGDRVTTQLPAPTTRTSACECRALISTRRDRRRSRTGVPGPSGDR